MPSVRSSTPVAVAGDLGLAAVVVLVALWLDGGTPGPGTFPVLAILAGAAAVGLSRTLGFVALVLIWLAAGAQTLADTQVVSTALAIVVVGYRCGRHAGRLTVWCAVLSVPAGAAAAIALARLHSSDLGATSVIRSVADFSRLGVAGSAIALVAILGAPLAVGLLVRVNERYRVSRTEQQAAEAQAASEHEIAQSRAKQTQLARDVHDVVGHSLAVIIAQADAARLVATDDDVRNQLEQIATVGRSSLAEVRDVLNRTDDAPDPTRPVPELDELIGGVRAAGHTVHDTTAGSPSPLTADTSTAAYRVLQELLTNALKHGSGGAIDVEREWAPDGLTLRVTNPVAETAAPPVAGMGLSGVHDRVAGAGGTVRVALTGAGTERARVIATAYLPVA